MAESCPPPTPCRCQQNPTTCRNSSVSSQNPPQGAQKHSLAFLPPASHHSASSPSLRSLPARHRGGFIPGFFLPSSLLCIPQPMGQHSPAPNCHPAFTPELSAAWQTQRGSTTLRRRQLQVRRKTFQLAAGDTY